MIAKCIQIIVGLGSGIVIGSAIVAFLIILDVLPRLAQITKSFHRTHAIEWSVISGVVLWTIIDIFHWKFTIWPFGLILIATFMGMFIGMLVAALSEVLNVFPIMTKRLSMRDYLSLLLFAVIFGKIFGSLMDWLVLRIN